jgi:hypothetical protein
MPCQTVITNYCASPTALNALCGINAEFIYFNEVGKVRIFTTGLKRLS